MRARSLLSSWFPVVAWAGLIFGLSSVPSLQTGWGGWDFFLRKAAHMVEYAILALLLVRALARTWPAEWPWRRVAATAAMAAVAYAISDEVHQAFVPGRGPSPTDVAIDAVGVVIGLLAARPLAQRLAWPVAG